MRWNNLVLRAGAWVYWRGEGLNSSFDFNDRFVIMGENAFKKLPNYSISLPGDTTPGKRWKCGSPYSPHPTRWDMGEYTDIGDPDNVGIKWHEILVL